MPVVKVSELIAESDKGWEEAAQADITKASKTVRNIKHVYIERMQGIVEGDKIVKFRVNAKVFSAVEHLWEGMTRRTTRTIHRVGARKDS